MQIVEYIWRKNEKLDEEVADRTKKKNFLIHCRGVYITNILEFHLGISIG